MFAYPEQAEFNRPVPKNKIHGYAKPSRANRDRCVLQVSETVWKYKLAPETVNLPAKPSLQEIQVFAVALKTGELGEDVLRIPSLRTACGSRRPTSAPMKPIAGRTSWRPTSKRLDSLQVRHVRNCPLG
jgi:hypothetical protein